VDKQIVEFTEIKVLEIPIRGAGNPEERGALQWTSEVPKPNFGGVYAFWWKGTFQDFMKRIQEKELHFKGPVENGKPSKLELNLENGFFGTAENGMTCLYVGKTHASIAKRVGLHLRLGVPRTLTKPEVEKDAPRSTTSCQVRDRLDRLFPYMDDTRELVNELALSYIKLDGPDHFVERFFLEDLAIGHLRPIFNVDSER